MVGDRTELKDTTSINILYEWRWSTSAPIERDEGKAEVRSQRE